MATRGSTLIEVMTALTAFMVLAGSAYVATCRHGLDAERYEEAEAARHVLEALEERGRVWLPVPGSSCPIPLPSGHGLRDASATASAWTLPAGSGRRKAIHVVQIELRWTSACGLPGQLKTCNLLPKAAK